MSGFWDRVFELLRPVPQLHQLRGLAEPMPPQERSFRLLVLNLSVAQRKQWIRYNYFDVIGGDTGTCYRIRPGRVLNVTELNGSGGSQRLLCFEPVGRLPARRRHVESEDCPRAVRVRRSRRSECLSDMGSDSSHASFPLVGLEVLRRLKLPKVIHKELRCAPSCRPLRRNQPPLCDLNADFVGGGAAG